MSSKLRMEKLITHSHQMVKDNSKYLRDQYTQARLNTMIRKKSQEAESPDTRAPTKLCQIYIRSQRNKVCRFRVLAQVLIDWTLMAITLKS